jgi:hypothetical protein
MRPNGVEKCTGTKLMDLERKKLAAGGELESGDILFFFEPDSSQSRRFSIIE